MDNWKVNIFNSIRDISDIEIQKLTWLGKHPTYVSSFSETINTLYDDYDFEEYLVYYGENENNEDLYSKMVVFEEKLSKYIPTEKTDLEILNDFEWENITQLAYEVIKLWIVG